MLRLLRLLRKMIHLFATVVYGCALLPKADEEYACTKILLMVPFWSINLNYIAINLQLQFADNGFNAAQPNTRVKCRIHVINS